VSLDRLDVEGIEMHAAGQTLRYRARRNRLLARLESYARHALGQFERFMGSNTFEPFLARRFCWRTWRTG
jgi:hypothetical protein